MNILLCINVFFCTSSFCSLPAADIFPCSRLRGTQGARPNTTAQVWALDEVHGTCSGGSKFQVTTERHSEHVEPSRSIQTHVKAKKMSDGLRRSFIILLTARTYCLPTSRLCSNARARVRVHLVLMLECSWPCSRAHVRARLHLVVVFAVEFVLVLECSSACLG